MRFRKRQCDSCVLVMAARIVVLVCLFHVAAALLVAPSLQGVEEKLASTCGFRCLSFLEAKSVLLKQGEGSNASRSSALLKAVAGDAAGQLKQASSLASAQLAVSPTRAVAMSGVPCSTPAACALKTLGANKCNYGRIALQSAYNDLNVATHVLGVLVSSLCGCLHSGHVSTCAMSSLPATCTFPYTVYAKAFAGSIEVWEAVKASTQTCILHGSDIVLG